MKQTHTLLLVALFTVLLALSSVYQPMRNAYAQNGTLPPGTVLQTAPPTAWCDENPCEREPTLSPTPTPSKPTGVTPTGEPPEPSTFTPMPPPSNTSPPVPTGTVPTLTETVAPPTEAPSTFVSPPRAKENDTANSQLATATSAPDLTATVLQLAQRQPILAVNRNHPLTDRLLAAGYAPVSPIFAGSAASLDYTAQRGENLLSGEGRIFYWLERDRSRVRTVAQPLADNDAFALALLRESSVQQQLHLNLHAALQHTIAQAGFLPISNEFTLTFGGVGYIAQVAQERRSTIRRVYYVATGVWEQVEVIAFN